MRTATAIVLLLLVSIGAHAADPAKVSLNAASTPLKEVCAQLSEQTGCLVVLDPKAQGQITLSLQQSGLAEALDAITKVAKLGWKKVQFARPQNDAVKLDQIKSAIVTLAALPVIGIAVEDPVTGTSAVSARDLPTSVDTASIKLPAGYVWTTAYVVLVPEAAAQSGSTPKAGRLQSLTQSQTTTLAELANLSSEERKQFYASEMTAQMNMTPEVRRAMLKDRMQAVFTMDPRFRDEFRNDMRAIWSDIPNARRSGDRNPNRAGNESRSSSGRKAK